MLSRVAAQTARRASSLLSPNVARAAASSRTLVGMTSRSTTAAEWTPQISSTSTTRHFHGAMGPLNMPVKLVEVRTVTFQRNIGVFGKI
jgi:hypothetical protein